MDMWGQTVFWHPKKLDFFTKSIIWVVKIRNIFFKYFFLWKIIWENYGIKYRLGYNKKCNNPLFPYKMTKKTYYCWYICQIWPNIYFKYPSMYFFGRKMIWIILFGITILGYTKKSITTPQIPPKKTVPYTLSPVMDTAEQSEYIILINTE